MTCSMEEEKVASNCVDSKGARLERSRTLAHVALLVRATFARSTGRSDKCLSLFVPSKCHRKSALCCTSAQLSLLHCIAMAHRGAASSSYILTLIESPVSGSQASASLYAPQPPSCSSRLRQWCRRSSPCVTLAYLCRGRHRC